MVFLDIFKGNHQNFQYDLYLYLMSKALLYIKVTSENQTFYVCFQDTLYFEGFRSWSTTNFERQSDGQCIALLNLAGYGTGLVSSTEMVTLGGYQLIQARNVVPKVQIICQYINYYTQDDMHKLEKLD